MSAEISATAGMSPATKTEPPRKGLFYCLKNMKQVTLENWAANHFDPPPSLWTLRKMVREGRIDPPAVKVGKSYYVQEDARPIDPNRRPSLVERLRKAG